MHPSITAELHNKNKWYSPDLQMSFQMQIPISVYFSSIEENLQTSEPDNWT